MISRLGYCRIFQRPSSRLSFWAAKLKRACCASHGFSSCSSDTVFISSPDLSDKQIKSIDIVDGLGQGYCLHSCASRFHRRQLCLLFYNSWSLPVPQNFLTGKLDVTVSFMDANAAQILLGNGVERRLSRSGFYWFAIAAETAGW